MYEKDNVLKIYAADLAIELSLEVGDTVPINMEMLRQALNSSKPTTIEWFNTARNYAIFSNDNHHYDAVLDYCEEVLDEE